MPLHKDLTGAELHEPKGCASAAANTVYIANGAGTGAWDKIDGAHVDLATAKFNRNPIHFVIPDVSVPGVYRVPLLFAGSVGGMYMVLSGALTVADENLYIQRASDSAYLHSGAIVIPYAASAAGTAQYWTATNNQAIAGLDHLIITYMGLSTGPASLFCTLDYAVTSA